VRYKAVRGELRHWSVLLTGGHNKEQ